MNPQNKDMLLVKKRDQRGSGFFKEKSVNLTGLGLLCEKAPEESPQALSILLWHAASHLFWV